MTGRWRPLPSSLEPEVAYLVGLLREFKDRSGLSLAALAAKTAYSKSSWERYLNGTTLPPRHAVEALARLVGEPVDRLLALWERAEARWSGRAGQTRPAATPSPAATTAATDRDPGPSPSRPRSRGWVFATVAVCAVAAGLVVLVRPLGIIGVSAPTGSSAPAHMPVMVGCHGAQCAGQDADGMACDIDAASFADLQVGGAYLELRISDQCGSAWARISHSSVGDRVQVLDQDGRGQAVTVPDTASTGRYLPTLMIPADRHSHTRACLQRPDGERRCTPWGADHPVPVHPTQHPRRRPPPGNSTGTTSGGFHAVVAIDALSPAAVAASVRASLTSSTALHP